jgi:hypothetical protein
LDNADAEHTHTIQSVILKKNIQSNRISSYQHCLRLRDRPQRRRGTLRQVQTSQMQVHLHRRTKGIAYCNIRTPHLCHLKEYGPVRLEL